MRLGFQFQSFDQPAGSGSLGAYLGEVARLAEEAGYDDIWTMDHLLQLQEIGPVDAPMVEAYTTLGFLAAYTSRVRLGALVTGPMLRHPGMLIKQITTLDALSGGRAMLGIGASWYEREHAAFGIPFPPLAERFERLEEILRLAHQMWRGDARPFAGTHYRLAEPINAPPAVSRPHPPILVGGGGEQKTLRLVARYADACNFFDGPRVICHKLEVLRAHCAEIGRPYEEIERTAIIAVQDLGSNGEGVGPLLEQFAALADAGIQAVYGTLAGPDLRRALAIAARDLIPQAKAL